MEHRDSQHVDHSKSRQDFWIDYLIVCKPSPNHALQPTALLRHAFDVDVS
jgi:hypothetical protein